MAKRKKKLPDIEKNLDTLKEQEGEPVIGKLEGVEVKVGEIWDLAETIEEPPQGFVTNFPKNRLRIEDIIEKVKPKMPPTSEIFSIKDQGSSRLVIKKDGTKLTIPK